MPKTQNFKLNTDLVAQEWAKALHEDRSFVDVVVTIYNSDVFKNENASYWEQDTKTWLKAKEWSRTTNKGKSETVITKEAKMLMISDKLIAKMKQFQKRAWGEGKNAPRLPDGVDKRWGLSGERGRKTTTKEILSLFDENMLEPAPPPKP